ncbi:hypothetical protein [Devosia ginsengisoli]|uniref:Uncharacterized protein n=1 Tax=Devosia ginsengisoli TaxID=400770 RepID=A0A5B8LRM4_9HYPH|nr:hypothetical protein [Devosia ginsengisoli]QDZ10529.1 hypothetical protein FPZ08_07055 [Devosia ginsengisoli]
MRDLVATKSLVYATRRLQAGDYFTTRTHRDAQILVAIGKAKATRTPGKIDAPPAQIIQRAKQPHDANGKKGGSKIPDGDKDALNKLRADYQTLVGKRAFAGWDAVELQRRIDLALAS